MAYLYRHIRLDKNEPFYIGIGSTKKYYRAYSSKNRNKYWENVVSKTDYEVEILFDNIEDDFAIKKEIEFIALYGRKDLKTGCLVNMTNGGDGCLGKIISKETAKKIGDANRGRVFTKELKKRLSEIHKKRYQNPENIKKHKENLIGVKKKERSLEHRLKISENNRKRVYTDEIRKNMSEAAKKRIKNK